MHARSEIRSGEFEVINSLIERCRQGEQSRRKQQSQTRRPHVQRTVVAACAVECELRAADESVPERNRARANRIGRRLRRLETELKQDNFFDTVKHYHAQVVGTGLRTEQPLSLGS